MLSGARRVEFIIALYAFSLKPLFFWVHLIFKNSIFVNKEHRQVGSSSRIFNECHRPLTLESKGYTTWGLSGKSCIIIMLNNLLGALLVCLCCIEVGGYPIFMSNSRASAHHEPTITWIVYLKEKRTAGTIVSISVSVVSSLRMGSPALKKNNFFSRPVT